MKINLIIFIVLICAINIQGITMENKLYHHLPDGKFRNPEGSPERKENVNWSFRTFNKEKRYLYLEEMHIDRNVGTSYKHLYGNE